MGLSAVRKFKFFFKSDVHTILLLLCIKHLNILPVEVPGDQVADAHSGHDEDEGHPLDGVHDATEYKLLSAPHGLWSTMEGAGIGWEHCLSYSTLNYQTPLNRLSIAVKYYDYQMYILTVYLFKLLLI